MKLEEAIVACCDAAEMAALAAGLGIDPQTVSPGELLPEARAVALLEAAGRAGRARDLTAALSAAHPAVAWAELSWPPTALAPLHADLCRRHTLDSLRTLCFRLGLDYDELPGETKSGRARELVLAMNRAGRVMELWGDTRHELRDMSGGGDELGITNYELRMKRVAGGALKDGAFPRRWGMHFLLTRISYLVFRILPLAVVPAVGGAALLALAAINAHDAAVPLVRLPSPAVVTPSPSATPAVPLSTTHAPLSSDHAFLPLPTDLLPSDPLPTDPLTDSSIEPLPTVHSPLPTIIVGARGANLRRGPSAGFTVVATLRAGARLELLAVSATGEWYQVRFPGHGSPWIDAGYAEIAGGTGGLPVVTLAAPSGSAVAPTAEPGSRPTNGPPATPTPRPTVIPTPTTAVPGVATAAPTRTAPPPPLPLPTLPPP